MPDATRREGANLAEEVPDRFLAVARLVRPQGRRGELLAESLTDFPLRFQCLDLQFQLVQCPSTILKAALKLLQILLLFLLHNSLPTLANR